MAKSGELTGEEAYNTALKLISRFENTEVTEATVQAQEQAIQLLHDAAKKRFYEAYRELGAIYAKGEIVRKDLMLALRYYDSYILSADNNSVLDIAKKVEKIQEEMLNSVSRQLQEVIGQINSTAGIIPVPYLFTITPTKFSIISNTKLYKKALQEALQSADILTNARTAGCVYKDPGETAFNTESLDYPITTASDDFEKLYKYIIQEGKPDAIAAAILEKLSNLRYQPSPANPQNARLNIGHQDIKGVSNKMIFLQNLETTLSDDKITRADILQLFANIKDKNGTYEFIHQQRHKQFDKVRLFFKSKGNEDENNFWHTATYQKAIGLLKKAYLSRSEDNSIKDSKAEKEFINYVRGNSPVHFKQTSSRKQLDKQRKPKK